jgi:hypothetical protein
VVQLALQCGLERPRFPSHEQHERRVQHWSWQQPFATSCYVTDPGHCASPRTACSHHLIRSLEITFTTCSHYHCGRCGGCRPAPHRAPATVSNSIAEIGNHGKGVHSRAAVVWAHGLTSVRAIECCNDNDSWVLRDWNQLELEHVMNQGERDEVHPVLRTDLRVIC